MGFGYKRARPVNFYDLDSGNIDWKGFREELRGKLLTDHVGWANGVSTKDLATYFYHRTDLEACLSMENEMQFARYILLGRGTILRNAYKRWHIVDNAEEAYRFLHDRSMRLLRAHARTVTASLIATKQFPELAESSLPKALASMSASFKRLEKAMDNDSELLAETTTEE